MLPLEHSAILLTCIKRYSVLKTNFGLLFEWSLKTGFTVPWCKHFIGLWPSVAHGSPSYQWSVANSLPNSHSLISQQLPNWQYAAAKLQDFSAKCWWNQSTTNWWMVGHYDWSLPENHCNQSAINSVAASFLCMHKRRAIIYSSTQQPSFYHRQRLFYSLKLCGTRGLLFVRFSFMKHRL